MAFAILSCTCLAIGTLNILSKSLLHRLQYYLLVRLSILILFVTETLRYQFFFLTACTISLIFYSRIIDLFRGQTPFTRNANKLFKELLSFSDDNFNPIQIFSAKELKKATNNYDEQQIIVKDGYYNLYRGLLPGCPIIVKKFVDTINTCEEPFKDIVFASVFGSHDNMLMLLGCCLDTQLPILVFEYAENGTLGDRIFKPSTLDSFLVPNYKFINRKEPLKWKCRLQISMDLCNAIAYLHTQFPKPIIHRDIKTRTILLDKQNSPKLFDFSLSVAIPDGKLWKEDMVKGTYGYIAPEYISTCRFNEKVDVYSLGAVLLELLSGKTMYELSRVQVNGKGLMDVLLTGDCAKSGLAKNVNDIVDVTILEEPALPDKQLQLQAFAAISLECLSCDVEKRPTINQVSRLLYDINSMATSLI